MRLPATIGIDTPRLVQPTAHGAAVQSGLRVSASFCFTVLSIEAFFMLFSFSQNCFFLSRQHFFVPAESSGRGPRVTAKAFS